MSNIKSSKRGFLDGNQLSQKLEQQSVELKKQLTNFESTQCDRYREDEKKHPNTIMLPERCLKPNDKFLCEDGFCDMQKSRKAVTKPIFFTSYNPVNAQTDSSPCTGASGVDQCKLVASNPGTRIIALSQDLVGRNNKKAFKYGDRVWLQSNLQDPRCQGEFLVLDTMNARFRNRGDIFFQNRKNNISCWATITKL